MDAFFVYIFQHSLLAGVVVLFLLLVRLIFFGRLSPRIRHALWFFLVPVLLLPTPVVPIPVRTLEPGTQSPARVEPILLEPVRVVEFSSSIEEKTATDHSVAIIRDVPMVLVSETVSERCLPSLVACLAAVWLVGMVALMALSLMQVLRLRCRFRKAEKISDENVFSVLEHCKTAMNVRSPVGLVESGRILCPALIGMMKPRIILPAGFAGQCGDVQLSHLLCHELAHLKRRDILIGYLASLLCFVHWFNPLVWIAVRKMNDDAEEAADQLVMQTLDRQHRIEYGRTLLSLAERYYSVSKKMAFLSRHVPGFVGLMESSTQLSRRIEMIKKHDTWRRGWMFLAVLLCLAVSATALVRVRFVEARTVNAAEPTEKPDAAKEEAEIKIKPAEVKQGEFKSFAPVQDKRKTKVFGRVLKPDGEVADGIVFQFRGYPYGWTTSSGGGVPRNGIFDVEIPANSSYIAAVFDKKNRYAAPLLNIKVGDEAPEGELVFQFEEGVPLTASFLDETTSKPISGLKIYLAQKVETAEDDLWIDFEKESDENGLFEAHVLPGEYVLSIDSQYFRSEAVQKGVYARKFSVEKEKPAKIEFRIPTPFTGKVFDAAGVPAKDQIVFVIPTMMGQSLPSQVSTFTKTDKDGIFRRIQPPVNATVEIRGRDNGQYFAWFADELADSNEAEFRLVEGVEVKGRLLDAETREPLADQLFFHWKKNPKQPKQQAFSPGMWKTNKQGNFSIKLDPTLMYDLFVVHGRQSMHGGGPYYPRIDLAKLTPESFVLKTTLHLGDLLVDPGKATGDPSSFESAPYTEYRKQMRDAARMVKRGEKKALLLVTVKEGGEATREYVKKHRDEEPFASFAVLVVDYQTFPKEIRDRWENGDDETIRSTTPEKVVVGIQAPKGGQSLAVLSQLRGEKDSPWNVPKDDASNQNDWKKTPGMANPKILRAFLEDYLKR